MVGRRGIAAAGVGALGLLGLAGCATKPVPVQLAETPIDVQLSPAAPVLPRPMPPGNVAANFATPPRLPNGNYVTVNTNIGPDDVVWNLRSALNVAAIGCRGSEGAALVNAYNAMLTADSKPLKAAYDGSRARYKASFGKEWETQWDQQSTRVYNFFSQIVAHAEFCIAAAAVADQVKAVPPASLPTFAAAVLPRLEQPFTNFYRAYDAYRVELAQWEAQYGGGAVMAAAGTIPALASSGYAPAGTATSARPAAVASLAPPIVYVAPIPPSVARAPADQPAQPPRLNYAPVGDAAGTR